MTWADAVLRFDTAAGQHLHHLATVSQGRHTSRVLAIALMAAATVLFVEVHFDAYGHGTHLLAFLLIGLASGITAGPVPAACSFVIGAVGSGMASVLGLGPADPAASAVAQLVLYGIAGSAFALLLFAMVRHYAGSLPASRPMVPDPAARLVDPLSARELDVLRLAASGKTTRQISELLFVSPNTVKTHLAHAYQKLGAQNRADAIRAGLHCGCLVPTDICPHRLAARGHDTSNG